MEKRAAGCSHCTTQSAKQTFCRASLRYRIPAVSAVRGFVDEGGLMSYAAAEADMYGQASVYVDKILKGAKPADLPVEQPTRFVLIINMKTAKALG